MAGLFERLRLDAMLCSEMQRPSTLELFGMFLLSFAISVALAFVPSFLPASSKLRSLPPSQIWRVRVTVASLQQPLAMMFLMPPQEALRILVYAENPWMISAPRHLWLALFYLFGAWAFEVLVLLHPATGAKRAYGKKGWWVQIVHHVGFPSLSLHNIISGCAVPGTAIACCTELTVLFSSLFWLLKMGGFSDQVLRPVQQCMQVSTYALRGAFVLLLDVFALANDQTQVPFVSWCIQAIALVATNGLNLMIVQLVRGAVNRQSKGSKEVQRHGPAGTAEGVVGLAVRTALRPLGRVGSERVLRSILEELCAATDMRIAFRSGFPGVEAEAEAEAPAAAHCAAAAGEVPPAAAGAASPAAVLELMRRVARETTGLELEADAPLMDAGLDSKSAVQFGARLAEEFRGVDFPATLIFDYPTMSAMSGYAAEQLRPQAAHQAVPERALTSAAANGLARGPLAIVGTACHFPGGSARPDMFDQHLSAGTDGVVEVPFTRWEIDEYYDVNPDAIGKMYARHGAFVEGADLFAASFFSISAPEARAMDPQQRMVLEVSHDGLRNSGFEKKALLGTDVAVLVGQTNNDWIQLASEDMKRINPYTATGLSASISAARVAYALGLKGPAYVVDTACSSALVALDSASANLQRRRCSAAVSVAANVMCSVATYVSFSKPRMLSVLGRSLSFDATANGYGRGEGCGATVLERVADSRGTTLALVAGTAVNQDGLSSTMTAPNGPSQQAVVRIALREAGLPPHETSHMECHGTGTPLGDPIEVGALQAVNAARAADRPLVLAAVKSNLGHLEGAAACPGLLKTVVLLQHRSSEPSCHFQSLNPHIENKTPQAFSTEHFPLHAAERARAGGLSSFGFGGTNAHAVVEEAGAPTHRWSEQGGRREYQRRPFPWKEAAYRLLRQRPQDGHFEVAMTGDVYNVVKHHVVFGSIVVPGVVFSEMALEATRKLFGQGVVLADITMVFPFVVQYRVTDVEPASIMRFVLRGEDRFEIQSTSPAGKVTQHVEGKIDRNPSPPQHLSTSPVDLESLRSQIAEPVDVSEVYAAIDTVGLYLGPMFQVAKELWRTEADAAGCREVLGHLELDPKVPNVGYLMHPALFDGTIHILATASIGKTSSDLLIYGGLGRAITVKQDNFSTLGSYWVHLTVTEMLEASQTFNVKVMADDGAVLMLMENVVFRAVKPEQIQMAIAVQGAPADDTKLYEVDWTTAFEDLEAEADKQPDEGKWLVVAAEETLLDEFKLELGDGHDFTQSSQLPLDNISDYSKVVYAAGVRGERSSLDVLDLAVRLMQALVRARRTGAPALWLITCSAQRTRPEDTMGGAIPLHAGLWGLARTFRNECPDLRCFCLDVDAGASIVGLLRSMPAAPAMATEPEVAARGSGGGGELRAPRLADVTGQVQAEAALQVAPEAAYLITGGVGALGLVFAQWLADQGAKQLALLSRSGRPPADSARAFRKLGSAAVVHKGDVSSAADVRATMQAVAAAAPRLAGIMHAAGGLDDHMIPDLSRSHLEAVLTAKVDGTLHLHEHSSCHDLDFFAMFSSVAAMIGSVGQANYSAANAFMDSFASYRRARGQCAASVQWGPWADVGMAARAGTSETSIARLGVEQGLKAMQAILESPARGFSGVIGVARIDWKSLLGQAPVVPMYLKNFKSALASRKGGVAAGNYTQADIKALVVGSLSDVLGTDEFDLSTPLMEIGLDSLAGVEFRNRLAAAFDGVQLSSTLMFDYPTVPDLVDYIWSQVGPAEDDDAGAMEVGDIGEQLALAGHSGRFPGSSTNHPGELWQTLRWGLDTSSELPPERWDINAFYDEDVDAPGKTYVKLGHFIPGVDSFDGEFFGISEAEQRGMDQHQWLTTEIIYDAFHAAGMTKETLNGLECGVYVGCATLGGIEPDIPAFGPFTNIGYSYSGLSGRVSHVFSLRGPCFTIDTACSSTVVALDCGSQAIKIGRAKCAVAGGANLQTSAAIWVGFAKMRGLAADGNCKTFDRRADGFARGEGLGAVFVQRAGASGGEVPACALLGGVAVNHDGRAATITAPNGTAQQRVLRIALGERGLQPSAVSCLECHGTGTALGDPIEVGAQKAVYGKGRAADDAVVLAALKSNIGHLEGTAGVAGLSKVVLMLQRAMVPPALWLENLNPNIDLGGFGALMPVEQLDWRQGPHRASVSSFGFSGTNGHAVLERAERPLPEGAAPARLTMGYKRRVTRPWNEWLKGSLYSEEWVGVDRAEAAAAAPSGRCLVVGVGPLAEAIRRELVAREVPPALDLEGEEGVGAVIFAGAAEAAGCEEAPGESLCELLRLLQAIHGAKEPPATLLVVTRACYDPARARFDSSSALWGMARSARLEMPRLAVKAVDLELGSPAEQGARLVADALGSPASEAETAHIAGRGVCVPRLVRSPALASSLQRSDAMKDAGVLGAGAHLVTGGLGGLGLVAAQELAALGARTLVLVSRSGKPVKELTGRLDLLQSVKGLSVRCAKCDLASEAQVGELMTGSLCSNGVPLGSVVHAAGVLEHCVLPELDPARLAKTTGPKAAGAWHLHCAGQRAAANPSLVLFSSVSATVGLAGGAAYAAANAYLDALALWRSERCSSLSVRFGPVAEVGMTAAAGKDKQLDGMAMRALPVAHVASALRLILAKQALPSPLRGECMLARVDWAAFGREVGLDIPQLASFQQEGASAEAARSPGGTAASRWASVAPEKRGQQVLASIRESASGMGLDLEDDTPLMESGIDSLSAVEFRSKISNEFREVRLPSTLVFDYPSTRAIAAFISDRLVPSEPRVGAVAAASAAAAGRSPDGAPMGGAELALLGSACRLPGGSNSLQELACTLALGVDCAVEVPYARWDVEEYFHPEAPTGLEMYVRHGGFVEGADLFDAETFGISRAEAEAMDPQQRHLLEASLGAFVRAGRRKDALIGVHGGVFVGQDKCDWSRMLTSAHAGPFAATGGSASISSNRISYALGLKGPSSTVDTACSSTLVAADTAAATLRRGRCEIAVVCGVNMLLLPQTFIACCQAHMLSKDGRCHTFDSSASGYTRGEGCGAQVVGPTPSRDAAGGPLIELWGSALNQDGRSANLTSPNGPSQTAVVLSALGEARLAPSDLNLVETHGTGTELGDPIEVGALQSALSAGARAQPLLLGAVKTNVGHLEGGAGMAGLLKLACVLERRVGAANLHLRELNGHIFEDTRGFAVHFPAEPHGLPERSAPAAASVSSFGFGGTNGHVVVRSPPAVAAAAPAAKRVAFIFTGQGSQYVGMGRELYDSEPVFREALDRCARVLDTLLPEPLLAVLYPEGGSEAPLLDQTQFSQPAIFALEYALSQLWRSRGLQPCAVLGHSVGEYCAAVVAGVLALEDALRLIAARGRAIAEECAAGVGAMAAIFASEAEVRAAMSRLPDARDVAVAAVNGPKATVVSGRSEQVERVAAETGGTSRRLNVSHAFHSPLMAPALEPFRREVSAAKLAAPRVRFFSTLQGEEVTDEVTRPDYWVDHIKGTVYFSAGIEALNKSVRPDVFLEIGATPVLVGMAKRFLKGAEFLASMDPKAGGDLEVLKKAEAAAGGRRPPPALELRRQAFPWREPRHPLVKRRANRPDGAVAFSSMIDGHVLELLSHHIVHGEVVVPGACYLEMILAGCAEYVGKQEAWCVEGLGFAKPLVLRLADGRLEEPVELRLVLWPDGRLEVESELGADPEDSIVSTHVEATLVRQPGGWAANRPQEDKLDLEAIRARCPDHVEIDAMYSLGVDVGLPLQPRFRAVRQVQKGDRQGLARLEMERDGTQVGFLLGPSVIDSSFQALMSLADPEVGLGSLKIPLSIKRLQPTGRPFSIAVWSHFQLLEYTEHSTVFRSWTLNDAGEALLYFEHVHLQEVRDEHLRRVLQATGRVDATQKALYSTAWQPLEEQPPVDGEAAGDALLLGSPAHIRAVAPAEEPGIVCAVHGADVDAEDEEALLGLLQSRPWACVLFAAGQAEEGDVETLTHALHLLRAVLRCAQPPPVWLVTRGAQPLADEGDEARARASPAHAGLWGFVRAARMEDPDRLPLGCLDLEPGGLGGLGGELARRLPALRAAEEVEVAARGGLLASRLERSATKVLGPLRLNMPVRGSLTGLRPVPQAGRRPAPPQCVQLRVRAVGLNFRDVLNVMGLYPGDPGPPGADCSGTVLELGDLVSHLGVADDVFGEAPGCLGTYSVAPAPLMRQKPASWSYEQACAMPVIFATVEEALGDLANLKRGERVLIHAAAGGIGLVAIQYAKHVGAEIYATAGAEEKHEYLRSLGVKHITSSRDGKRFEADMRGFLDEAGADGVDVVLNSLSHDDYIHRSLRLLRPGGRFMEIGKRGVLSHAEAREARPDVAYDKIVTDHMMEMEAWTYNGYLGRLLSRVEEGGLAPINLHVFQGLGEGVRALQFLQRAQNIGKVVVSEPSRMLCTPSATQVVSGGTGALGVMVAQFLVEEGSKSLWLLSRSGRPPAEVRERWEWLQASSTSVAVQSCDVSRPESVQALPAAARLGALLHLAGALADGLLGALSRDLFERAYGAKVHGLHYLCGHLRFDDGAPFVLFSSTSSLFGAPGQGNYAAANAALDALAPHWSALGKRRARSVQWGPWAEAGMAVEKGTIQRAKASGLGALTCAQGMTAMGSVLTGDLCLVGAAHVRWDRFLPTVYGSAPPFLASLDAETRRAAGPSEEAIGALGVGALLALPPEERAAAVREAVVGLAKEVTGNEDLQADDELLESGMDSLSGVEFRNRLQKEFGGIRIPNSAVFDFPTAALLAGFVEERLAPAGAAALEAAPVAAVAPAVAGPSAEAELAAAASGTAQLLEQLNGCGPGPALLLVPGAGMQAESLRPLAQCLPLPAYGVSWPRGALPRERWPATLEELAGLILRELLALELPGPLLLAGHSFGASVCLEVARQAERAGERVALVALLDPRSLPPVQAAAHGIPGAAGLHGALALLSEAAPDGARYAEHLEALAGVDPASHDEALRKALGPAALRALEHVRDTSEWYAGLLDWQSGAGLLDAAGADAEEAPPLAAAGVLLVAEEGWRREPAAGEGRAAATVRAVQAATFQEDAEVSQRVALCFAEEVPSARVPGGHFGMLHEPGVRATALRLCHALVESGAVG